MTHPPSFFAPISEEIWSRKYRLRDPASSAIDETLDDTFWRVARAAAEPERLAKRAKEAMATRFHDAIADFGFLPAGRILAGAGSGRNVTLFNCFVLGRIDDDLAAIFNGVKDAALTMQAGGGIGHDFSTLRPRGAAVKSVGADASGPVSFMDVWDAMCRTIMSAGQRRGAMMATLRCDHPDIEEFIAAKSDAAKLRNFNLSVLVTDPFVEAVKTGKPWPLVFEGKTFKTVDARALWDRLMRATYEYAEPGVVFIDRINSENNLAYCETISATNPCGEQPLPPYGACLLGSINLAALVTGRFMPGAAIPVGALEERVRTAIRFLDNIIDVSRYPLEQQHTEAFSKRRIGLGVTGLADALIFSGVTYGTPEATQLAASWMRTIQNAAYLASAELARDKGTFPLYDAEAFSARPNVQRLDTNVRGAIAKFGIRNGCLTSIAPTGTISLLAGNVSSGIEPVFDFVYSRRVLASDGSAHKQIVEDFAHKMFRDTLGPDAPLPPSFITAGDLTPEAHLKMQAAMQPFVDSAISKTINCPEAITFEAFRDIYLQAHASGLKGCTTYRPNDVTGAVLQSSAAAPPSATAIAGQPQRAAPPQRDPARSGGVVYMSQPLEREPILEGATYKLKWPGSAHAIYVTINDIEQNGRRRPFEIFINTKNLEHYAWTVALTRMISAVFRRGGDVTFVAEELKAVFDPEGGRWMDGTYVPSLLAAIGDIIGRHMVRIGFLKAHVQENEPAPLQATMLSNEGSNEPRPDESFPGRQLSAAPINDVTQTKLFKRDDVLPRLGLPTLDLPRLDRPCPRCGDRAFVKRDGCWTCQSCLFSYCG